MSDHAAQRLNMVESQLRTNKVTDAALIGAMAAVPRERFLSTALHGVAYVDEDLPLGGDRYMMEPMVMARLIQALRPGATDVVLEIGTGCGYGAAILARLASTVVALESDSTLAASAANALNGQGIDTAIVVEGPLAEGYPKHGPYDAIFICGAVAEIPAAILDQVAEGGRLAAVIGRPGEPGRATLVQRRGGVLSRRVLFDAAVPQLPGFAREPGFVF